MASVSISAANFSIRPISDFDEFAAHCSGLMDQAAGSDLILFPELFTLELVTTLPDWQEQDVEFLTESDRFTADYMQFFAEQAKRRNQYIVAGSHLERRGEQYLNIGHLFGAQGEHYEHAKTHIFPAESGWKTSEGDQMQAVELPFAKVGFNICYEAEIPECASSLAEQGAELILCPSYTFTEYGFWRVRHCAQARAIENQVYFVHCSTGGQGAGPIPPGWTQSSILSPADTPWTPKGIVAEVAVNEEVVVSGTVDLDVLRHNRIDGAATTYKDRRRRAELYRSWPSHLEQLQTATTNS